MKILRFIPIMIALLCISCQEEEEDDGDKFSDWDGTWKTDKDRPPKNLKGTTWKLTGILDTQDDVLIKPDPKYCEACYTIKFQTRSHALGIVSWFAISFDLTNFRLHDGYDDFGYPFIDDNADIFRQCLIAISSYSLTPDELKILSEKHKKCLIFKLIEP